MNVCPFCHCSADLMIGVSRNETWKNYFLCPYCEMLTDFETGEVNETDTILGLSYSLKDIPFRLELLFAKRQLQTILSGPKYERSEWYPLPDDKAWGLHIGRTFFLTVWESSKWQIGHENHGILIQSPAFQNGNLAGEMERASAWLRTRINLRKLQR
jgi:hypothetical protein